MAYTLGVINGDGIGPEVVAASVEVLRAAAAREGLEIDLQPLPACWEAMRAGQHALPESTVEALRGTHGWIMGPHDSVSYPPEEQAILNPSGQLRKRFDLYANLRPARTHEGLPAMAPRIDLLIARENTEGFYADRSMHLGSGEFSPVEGVVLAVGLFTRRAAERIARVAFRAARRRRRKVTAVHKANVLGLAFGQFRDVCAEVGREFPDVAFEHFHVDAMAALLVRRPADFDVIVTTNMLGDILSDMTGELSGSLGLAPSINAGDEHCMAQAAHGSAPDIAGKGIANPVGLILSTAMLLGWLGERHSDPRADAVAQRMDHAVAAAIADPSVRTPDMGGRARTADFARAVVAHLG